MKGNTTGEVCVIINAEGAAQARKEISKAADLGARLVELRMDLICPDGADTESLVEHCHEKWLECIVTFRDEKEGGACRQADKARLYIDAANAGADYIDIEVCNSETISAIKPAVKNQKCRIIASWHDFGTQPALEKMADAIKREMAAGDVGKIAFVAGNKGQDAVAELLRIAKAAGFGLIVSPMGKNAPALRAFAARNGSPIAYCMLDGEKPVAAGVPTFSQLRKMIGKTKKSE